MPIEVDATSPRTTNTQVFVRQLMEAGYCDSRHVRKVRPYEIKLEVSISIAHLAHVGPVFISRSIFHRITLENIKA